MATAEALAVDRLNHKIDKALTKMEHYSALAKEAIHSEIRATPSNLKTAATPAAVGAAVMFLTTSDMIRDAELNKKHWWLWPVAILAVAYLLSRSKNPRNRAQAPTLMAVGGALLVLNYKNRPDAQKNTTPKPAETGALEPARLASQLHPMDNGYAWLQSPSGQLVRVELAPLLRQFGPMLQTTAITAPAQDAAARLAAAAFA